MSQRLGRYETIRQIATGGMATVYLGRVSGEGGFERLVALKVMHPHIAADPEFVGMFLDEARLAARIRHPNVVATMDIQKSPEGMFLVMEYVEGAALNSIRKHLKKRGQTIPLPLMLRIMLDTLNGLHEAHELRDDQGAPLHLVHRDVSPQNVLVGKDGVARITDFGVARAEARISSTRGGQLKGKLPYMPPEQIMNEAPDRRADVYAAGVVLWELLVGSRLFSASNEGALVHDIISSKVVSPDQKRASVPLPIAAVCMRALQRPREMRFDTAADFADALEDAAMQAGIRPARQRELGSYIDELRKELPEPSPDRLASGPSASHSMQLGSPAVVTPATKTATVLPSQPTRTSRPHLGLVAAALIGGATVVAVVVAISLISGSFSNAKDASPAAANPTSALPAASQDATAPPLPNAPSSAVAAATASAATTTTAATSSATASASAVAKPTNLGKPSRWPVRNPVRPRSPRPQPTSTGTNYRPSGL